MQLHPASYYVRELKRSLPAAIFRPEPLRLLWLPIHLAVVTIATWAIEDLSLPWLLVPVLPLMIGMSFAGLMFLGHETLHGGVLHGKWARALVGWVCFAPFLLSQRLWVIWHNRVHHANPNKPGADPDMYPTIAEYEKSPIVRFTTDNFILGGRRKRGVLSLMFGFLVQSKWILRHARTRLNIGRRDHVVVIMETALQAVLWIALAAIIGPISFLFAFLLPLVIADVIVMGFIVTNHSLSPAIDINDPLINTLSVTTPRCLEWVTLDFGYHVEHHLFPAMSCRHGREVREAIRDRWPERYQSMPLLSALLALHRTGRVYKNETTLSDPRTGGEWPALAPREAGAASPPTPRPPP